MINTPYSLVTISSLVLFFYIVSLVFSKTGIYPKKIHRQIWNVLLLITFFTSALIGLILVIKINYKLQLPFYDSLLKYHVEFGIAMAIISIIHFSWHIKYYLNLFKKSDAPVADSSVADKIPVNDIKPASVKLAVFLIGFTSIIAQIILLREFISVFSGNELVIGVILTNWMVLTAAGAFLGKSFKRTKNYLTLFSTLLIMLPVFTFISAFFINYLRNIVFPPGVMISIYQVFYSSFILLLPVCLLVGIAFTVLAKVYSTGKNQNLIGTIYGIESAGSIAGGLLFSFLLVFIFSQYHSLLLLILINSAGIIFINRHRVSVQIYIVSILAAVLAVTGLFFNIEKPAEKRLFPNQDIIVTESSPYGNIVITNQYDEYNVYNNNVLLFNTGNVIENEESVHYAMCQHRDPREVLLLTGGLSGKLKEILKYNVDRIDYVEIDRKMVNMLKDSVNELKNKKVKLHISDPRRYVKKSHALYDVILMNLPEPSTIRNNRFYTIEYFKLLKQHLTKNGIISFSLLSSANYMNDEAVKLTSGVYFALKKVFNNVIIIPGEKNYFLASDGPLDFNISSKISNLGIENEYVNQYYIQDDLLEMRSETITESLIRPKHLNHDLKPLSYQQQVNYWLKYFKGKFWVPALLAMLFIIFIFYKLNILSKAMFVAGFSASGLEILIMFSLQVIFGNIYYLTGIVFVFFMLGLAIGAIFSERIIKSFRIKTLSMNHMILIVFSLLFISLVFAGTNIQGDIITYTLFALLTIILGTITGTEFSLVSKLVKGNYGSVSGNTYSSDLIGSAAGAFIITIYIVPWLGLILSAIFIGIMNLFVALSLILYSKYHK